MLRFTSGHLSKCHGNGAVSDQVFMPRLSWAMLLAAINCFDEIEESRALGRSMLWPITPCLSLLEDQAYREATKQWRYR